LRVLHGYAGNLYGGIESLLVTLASEHRLAPGLKQEFVLCFEGRLADELGSAGVTVHQVGEVSYRRPWTVWRGQHRFARLVANHRPDVVVCHSFWPQALFGPVVRRAGRPLVFWMHDLAGTGQRPEHRSMRVVPDVVLVNSHATATSLPRLYPNVPHHVLYYPVVPPAPVDRAQVRERVRRELGTAPHAVVIIQASRLEPWKGHSLLVAALGHLREQAGWVAWVAGGVQRPHEQAYLERLQAEARSAGIAERIQFLGQRSDVAQLLAAADIHCQPNTGPEPFGIAFVEALYAGLPVVSTRLGGAAEIITGDCGVLVSPDDPVALASALGKLIAEPQARTRLGAAGPERARQLCDPAAQVVRLGQLLSQFVATSRRRREP
jgi:glycosyltransferase involved in cell wall biosynthesis